MFVYRPIVALSLFSGTLAAYDVMSQWAWVDSSCRSKIDALNAAGEDYTNLVNAAAASVGKGSGLPDNPLQDLTATLYMGTHDAEGLRLKFKFNTLSQYTAGKHVPFSLYCDSTAFEWVTTYQEGKKQGQALPSSEFKFNGAWHTKPGRYNPKEGPLYISSTPKNGKRQNYCMTDKGEHARGVSSVGGNHIVLCPKVFTDSRARLDPNEKPKLLTSLQDMRSVGSTLLHEITHAALSTMDFAYGPEGCIALASKKVPAGSLPLPPRNADSYTYYALATLLNQRAWVIGMAQERNNYGWKALKKSGSTGRQPSKRQHPEHQYPEHQYPERQHPEHQHPTPVTQLWSRNATYVIESATPDPIVPEHIPSASLKSIIISAMREQSADDQPAQTPEPVHVAFVA